MEDFEVVEAIEDVFLSNGYAVGDPLVADLVETCAAYVLSGNCGSFSEYWERRNVDGVPALGLVMQLEAYATRGGFWRLPEPGFVIREALAAGENALEAYYRED